MAKGRAFILHISISALVMLIFFAVVRWVWYPEPYFYVSGGWPLLQLLALVDVVLGPILTAVVYRPGKAGLRFDISIIIALQLTAFAYGASVVFEQRPLFTVFAVDRFTAIPASEVDLSSIRYPELQNGTSLGPTLALVRLPENQSEREQLMFEVLDGAKDLEYRSEYYEPYEPAIGDLKRRSLVVREVMVASPSAALEVENLLKRHGGTPEDYLYFPLVGKKKDIIMVLSGADGRPLAWLNADPWFE